MRQFAKDTIDATEPYKGGKGNYLWILHELDIADKHRALLTAITCLGCVRIQVFESVATPPNLPNLFGDFHTPGFVNALKAGDVFFTCEAGKTKESQFTFEIGISEPCVGDIEPMIPHLNVLIDSVQWVIRDFEPLLV